MDTLKIDRRRKKHIEYDVALSFAEEDRPFVDTVAKHLKDMGLTIFYDRDALIDSWGKDLYKHLDHVYREKAKFCVLFISRHYKEKRWAQHESIWAQARSFSEHREYVLPFKFDDTEIEGVRESIVYLSAEQYDEQQLSEAIFNKIESSKPYWLYIRQRLKPFISKKAAGFSLLALIGCIGISWLPDKLTHREDLAKKLHERSKEIYHGATCNDSTFSRSHGKGTCSHHEGVAYYRDSIVYHKTMEECNAEAEQISWLP